MSVKQINYNFTATYQDNDIYQSLVNQLNHNNIVSDVKTYTNINKKLNFGDEYEADKQNFLFVASDTDFNITVDGKGFLLRELVLIQKDKKFNFKISVPSLESCAINLHVLHGEV